MKKIIALMAGIVLIGGTLRAQEKSISEIFSLGKESKIMHFQSSLPNDIGKVVKNGEYATRLLWAKDTMDWLEGFWIYEEETYDFPTWSEGTLDLGVAPRSVMLLHTTHNDIEMEGNGAYRALKLEKASDLDAIGDALTSYAISCSGMGSTWPVKGIIDRLFKYDEFQYKDVEPVINNWNINSSIRKSFTGKTLVEELEEAVTDSTKKEKKYDRTDFDFHWGFNNWGTSPTNGLMGMTDGGYDLRTSFSSYQLSYNYRVVMTKHFDIHVGLGYESDVYKFQKPYVDYADNAFTAIDTACANGYFSTRFVTRYVQLPIGIGYSAKTNRKGFNVKLTAIPALGYCGKHTGLKHETHQEGKNPQDQTNLKEALNPYKLDMRLDMDFGGMGVFLQVATLPVMVEGTKIHPVKIGFCL